MTAPLTFTVPGPPVPWQRAGLNRKTQRFYTPAKTQRYQGTIARSALFELQRRRVKEGKDWPLDARYRLELALYLPDGKTRDADNVLKNFNDALRRVTWRDDAQVDAITVRKLIDAQQPRAEVRIEVLP